MDYWPMAYIMAYKMMTFTFPADVTCCIFYFCTPSLLSMFTAPEFLQFYSVTICKSCTGI